MTPDNTKDKGTHNAKQGNDPDKGGFQHKRRGPNNRNRKKNAEAKARKKPSFVGLSHDKVKAVVADEPGLDPLSTQLEKLEKDVTAYAQSSMTAYVATAIRTLTPYDFDNSPLMPTAVSPSKYTTPGIAGAADVIDAAKKEIYENILKSKISAFVKTSQQYEIHMQQIYGIIEDNIDEGIKELIMGDPSYAAVQAVTDPIALIKLLRKMCRKEKGVDYSVATFHSCLSDLINSKQGGDTNIAFMEKIKLRYEVMTSQFGNDWVSTKLKDNVLKMHTNTSSSWSSTAYATCTSSEQDMIDIYTKDRLLAYIGVNGFSGKLTGGLTLKEHINNSAALNNNATVCYPSNITALLKLASAIATTKGKGRDTDRDRDKERNDRSNNNKEPDAIKKDGAQFTQTGHTGATQALTVGYSNLDDSDMYGAPSFLQTATVWYDHEMDDQSLDHSVDSSSYSANDDTSVSSRSTVSTFFDWCEHTITNDTDETSISTEEISISENIENISLSKDRCPRIQFSTNQPINTADSADSTNHIIGKLKSQVFSQFSPRHSALCSSHV